SHARRLQPVRGPQGEREGERRTLAGRGRRREGQIPRQERTRQIHQARQPDPPAMTTPPMLRQLRHDVWATEQLIEHCRGLTPEQLELTVPGTYGTIRGTLTHIVAADERYLHRFRPMPEPLIDEDMVSSTLDEIAAHLSNVKDAVEKLFAGQE